MYCHAGRCDTAKACESMGISMADLYPPKKKEELKLVATYRYLDANGTLLFEKLRYINERGEKTFRQRKRDGSGWSYKLGDTPRVLYNLPMVVKAVANGEPIWVVEGEKDADTLIKMGICATTMPNGAGTWLPIHTEVLAGATVDIVADKDAAGTKHAESVYEELKEAGCDVQVWTCTRGKDITDHLGAGGSINDLVAYQASDVVEESPERLEEEAPTPESGALTAITELLQRSDISDTQKLLKAELLIARTSSTKPIDTGRLVAWSEFVNESDDDSYDWVIPGLLERGERVIVVAAEGVGKRAAIDSVLPTPSGWTTLGDILVGDEVIDRFGNPVTVTYVSPIESNPDAYRVTFSDGNYIDADAEHQWYTETLNEREKRKLGGVHDQTNS